MACKEANCTAVAGMNMEWCFHTKAWHAEFVSGEFEGTCRTFAIHEVTQNQWDICYTLSGTQNQ